MTAAVAPPGSAGGQPDARVRVGLGVQVGVSRDLRYEPLPLPDGEEVRLTFSAGACR